jgi:hypothetical protein
MNTKRYIVAALVMFVFIFFYEWLVHGVFLMNTYQSAPHVWRSVDEMAANIPYSIFFQLALSAWTAFVFTRFYKEGGVGKGLLFGLYFGLFAAMISASWYLGLPVPATLGWSWWIASVIEGLISGAILGAIYKKR